MLTGHLYAKEGWPRAVRRGGSAAGLRWHGGRRRSRRAGPTCQREEREEASQDKGTTQQRKCIPKNPIKGARVDWAR
jgi:hypothetical protein